MTARRNTGQAVGSLVITANFLFSGLFVPPASPIPAFWLGLYYAVPTTHILRALAVSQSFCLGIGCPTVEVNGMLVGQFTYVSAYLGFASSSQYAWGELGWAALAVLVLFILALGLMQLLALKKGGR